MDVLPTKNCSVLSKASLRAKPNTDLSVINQQYNSKKSQSKLLLRENSQSYQRNRNNSKKFG